MTKTIRILLIILIILGVATAISWFKPDLFSTLWALNPFNNREEAAPVIVNLTPGRTVQTVQNTFSTSQTVSGSSSDTINSVNDGNPSDMDSNNSQEIREEKLSPLEKEIQQRHESYRTKIYSYEPYLPPVLRNPFQRIISSVYVGEEKEEDMKMASELITAEDVRRFVQPELPPDSKFTGLISSGEEKLAILEIDNETYIVKEGDILLDKFLVKSIQKETVIIEINGFEIPLKLGGGEATDD